MRITQHNSFLQGLLHQVTKGELLPAAFQRPYVWTKSDVLALTDSILRGYPVGSLLVWSPWGKADLSKVARLRLGPIPAGDDSKRVSLLLDGQNRLATMAWIASESLPLKVSSTLSEQEKETWLSGETLIADLEEQKVLFVPDSEAATGFRLPAAALLDSRIANTMIRAKWDTDWADMPENQLDEGMRWFDRAQCAFRETRVVVTEMADATAEEAKDAFLHICKVGVPMSEKDFEAALSWAFAK